jgi:hypothetical protein
MRNFDSIYVVYTFSVAIDRPALQLVLNDRREFGGRLPGQTLFAVALTAGSLNMTCMTLNRNASEQEEG